MNNKQILKKVERALKSLIDGKVQDTVDVLFELRTKLKEEIEREEKRKDDGKELQHLIGWYLQLWNDKPPEMFKFATEYRAIIAKHLKDLIQIYKRNGEDIEQLKKDYENFKRVRKDWNGLINFRNQLPNIKNKPDNKDWASPENQRGKNYYLKDWGKSNDDDEEDIPF
jgi:hypothetical protein